MAEAREGWRHRFEVGPLVILRPPTVRPPRFDDQRGFLANALVLEEAAGFPEVVEAGEGGESDGAPEGDLDEEAVFVGEPVEEAVFVGLHDDPDEGGDAEGELEGCLPLAEVVGGDDLAFFDGDLAEAGDEELAADDEGGGPDGAVFRGEVDEGGGNEDFVGEGVEEFAEGGDEVEFPGEVAVHEVTDGGDDEGDEGDEVAGGAAEGGRDDEDGGEDQAGEGDAVGKVHGMKTADEGRGKARGPFGEEFGCLAWIRQGSRERNELRAISSSGASGSGRGRRFRCRLRSSDREGFGRSR